MATRDPNLVGVGGWLLFFVIVLAVLSPLRLVVETAMLVGEDAELAAVFGESFDTIVRFEWALAALIIGVFWFLAWRLVKVHVWRSVQITIAGIWLMGPVAGLAEVAAIAMLADLPMAELSAGIGVALLQPTVFCIIWTAYLLKSVRVANTYAKPGHVRDVGEVFG